MTNFLHASTDDLERHVIQRCLSIYRANTGTTLIGGDEHGRAGFKQRFEQEAGLNFQSVPQTYVLGSALRALEGRLDDGVVAHTHCPLLNENVENLKVEELPNGNWSLRKKGSSTAGTGQQKIDGIISAINAIHLLDTTVALGSDVSWWVG